MIRNPHFIASSFKARTWLLGALTALATVAMVFVLPLFIPVGHPAVLSASYLAGFNNRAAVMSAAAIACFVFVVARSGCLGEAKFPHIAVRLTWPFVFTWTGVVLLTVAFAGWTIANANTLYPSDAGYFREQLTSFAVDGRHLYTQIEFPYGPLLMYFPAGIYAAIRPFGGSITAAYFVSLVMAHALGMAALVYVLNRLPIQTTIRRTAFGLFCLGSCVPLLGLNYTLLRFGLPLALLIFAHERRRRWEMVLLLTASVALEFAISPEIGLAFLFACWWYAAWGWRDEKRVSGCLFALTSLVSVVIVLRSNAYLLVFRAFGGGAFNLPVQPVPPILIFLAAFVWLVPVYLGKQLHICRREPESRRDCAILLSLFAFSIAMLASSLARCDPLHIFFSGLPTLILSLAAISVCSRRAVTTWIASLFVLVVWMQVVNLHVDKYEILQAVQRGWIARLPDPLGRYTRHVMAAVIPRREWQMERDSTPYHLDIDRLAALIGRDSVATPFEIDWSTEQQLRQSNRFRPDYFVYMMGVLSLAAEERKLCAFRQDRWALIPFPVEAPWTETPRVVGVLQGWRMPYPVRHTPLYVPRAVLLHDLSIHWMPVADFGPYRLYQNKAVRTPQDSHCD